jgi:hypothetical protein
MLGRPQCKMDILAFRREHDRIVTDLHEMALSAELMAGKAELPKNFFVGMGAFAFSLWLVSVGQDIYIYGLHYDDTYGIIGLLDVEAEKSFYTWFSVCLLFLTGFLASRQADAVGSGNPHYWQWVLVSVIFVYMSADEALSAHEKLAKLGSMFIKPEGFFRYNWVLPAMVIVAVVGVALIGLVRSLPMREQVWTYASGAVFLGGAAGMEMVTGKISDSWGEHTLLYQAFNSVEEGMEVLGVFMFIHVLMALERQRSVAGQRLFTQPSMHSDNTGTDTRAITNL